MKTVKILLASPSDVKKYRKIAEEVIGDINRVWKEHFDTVVETLSWEKDSVPAIGSDPQDIINKQLDNYKIVVAILDKKIGSPTPRYKSGTIEEIFHAIGKIKKGKKIKVLLYIKENRAIPIQKIDDYEKVKDFIKEFQSLGLYATFTDPLDFQRQLRNHIEKVLLEIFSPTKRKTQQKEKPKMKKNSFFATKSIIKASRKYLKEHIEPEIKEVFEIDNSILFGFNILDEEALLEPYLRTYDSKKELFDVLIKGIPQNNFKFKELRNKIKIVLNTEKDSIFYNIFNDDRSGLPCEIDFYVKKNGFLLIKCFNFYYEKFHHRAPSIYHIRHFPIDELAQILKMCFIILKIIYREFLINRNLVFYLFGNEYEKTIRFEDQIYDNEIPLYVELNFTIEQLLTKDEGELVSSILNEIKKSFQKDISEEDKYFLSAM